MKLVQLDIRNFRLLQDASLRISKAGSTTILVGPNNSGKTSVAEALLLFSEGTGKGFSIYDFSVSCWSAYDKAQAMILDESRDVKDIDLSCLPVMSMDLHLEYDDDGADLAVASDLLMDLDSESKRIRLRIEYAVEDTEKLAKDFLKTRRTNETLFDFLATRMHDYYSVSLFKASPDAYALRLMSVAVVDGLVNEGRNLVVLALVGPDLHIRIFDANGVIVVDKAENELVSGKTLTALKKRLNTINDKSGLSKKDKQIIIGDATSIAGHTTPRGSDETERLEERKVLDRLVRVDFVFAQRHIDDQEHSRAMRLSQLLHTHYEKHYKSAAPLDHREIEDTLKTHADDLGERYMKAFDGLIANLKQFGYPQRRAPSMSIKAELNATTLFRDNTRIWYGPALSPQFSNAPAADCTKSKQRSYELPEKYNGLGFKNLIYMILKIQSFRLALARMPADRPRVHLIFIEEPETHLHPQVQSVFIRQLSAFLNKDGDGTDAQVILTTHSSHIVADCGFAPIRYFRRHDANVDIRDLLEFESGLGTQEAVRFLSKYMSLMRCDLFFADKAILVEGQVERLLLPQMITECAKRGHAAFASEYISIMEVGGAHAHTFQSLLKFIAIPTLIITDIDAVDTNGEACAVASDARTSNATLKGWLPKMTAMSDLNAADAAAKTDGCIRVAYQVPEDSTLPCGRSFEEAFIYRNAEWLVANHHKLLATGGRFNKESGSVLIKDAYSIKRNISLSAGNFAEPSTQLTDKYRNVTFESRSCRHLMRSYY